LFLSTRLGGGLQAASLIRQEQIIRASHASGSLPVEMKSMFNIWLPWAVLVALAVWALTFRPERDSLNP
jgi:hypothetical protein